MRARLPVLGLALVLVACGAAEEPERPPTLFSIGPVQDFALTDQFGRPFTQDDLDGRFWVVDFIFTQCAGPCPRMTEDMRRLQALLPEEDVGLISISVDPGYDSPDVLKAYGELYGAVPDKWYFLTGDKALIYALSARSFLLPIEDPTDTDQLIHSTRFVVLDQGRMVRAYHDQQSDVDPKLGVIQTLTILRHPAGAASGAVVAPRPDSVLPSVNAVLNGTAALLLVCGWLAIRRKRVPVHRAFMLAAVACSLAFLVSYVTYHARHGSVKYAGEGPLRTLYLGILLTHTVLAAANVPLVAWTLWYAFRDRRERHRRLARVTLPSWLYVSVTGVVVYWMLYHGPGAP